HTRLAYELRERAREQSGRLRTAVEDELLARRGPLLVANAGAGEVHDRIDALERGGVDRARRRVPAHVVAPLGIAADETHDAVTAGAQSRHERGADHAVRTGDEHVHAPTVTVRGARTRLGRISPRP